MVRRSRRTRTVRVRKGESAWQWSRMKTLLFTEDVRPAYHGTFTRPNLPAPAADDEAAPDAFAAALADASGWLPDAPKEDAPPEAKTADDTKSSLGFGDGSVSRRRPLGKDVSMFDYSVDSEAEWEPEEEGEDLMYEDEEEKEEGAGAEDEEEDDWLVDDADPDAPIDVDADPNAAKAKEAKGSCLLYTSPSPRDQRGSRMPSSA